VSRDLRSYMKDTNTRLIVGALALLFIVGDGLIWLIYGFGAAMMGLLCMLGAFVPIGLILLFLNLSDWIVKRANRD
jgi:TM2 domain-containing membrane protein YozV